MQNQALQPFPLFTPIPHTAMNDRLRCFCQAEDLQGAAGWLTETRRHLHRHPELSFQEADTAGLVAKRLQEWGWQVTPGVGGHGVVGTMTLGPGRKSIALRADMDALPIQEATGKPWQSVHDGVMHACGHDGHTAILLGAAPIFQGSATDGKGKAKGRVVMRKSVNPYARATAYLLGRLATLHLAWAG